MELQDRAPTCACRCRARSPSPVETKRRRPAAGIAPRSARIDAQGTARTSVSECASASRQVGGHADLARARRFPTRRPRMAPVPARARRSSPDRAPRAAARDPRAPVDRERRAPRARAEDRELHLLSQAPLFAAGEALEVLDVLDDDEHGAPAAATITVGRGAWKRQPATGGSRHIADDRAERHVARQRRRSGRRPRRRRVSASGASARKAPTAVATPLPPRKP